MNSPLKGVILDWAGTTVDYGSCAPAGVFIEVFKRKGVRVTTEQARKPMGMHKRAHLQTIAAMIDVARQWTYANGKPCGDEDIEWMYREFVPLQLECLPRYSQLIPGVKEAADEFRRRGLKIGSTTGYTADMVGLVAREAARQGFEPDAIVSASDVKAGRPAPWMALHAAEKLGIYPPRLLAKIGDTVADVEEGLNAGMWSIGVSKTGNELGLNEDELGRLSPVELDQRLEAASDRLLAAGAHYVVESVADVLPLLDAINMRLERGERP